MVHYNLAVICGMTGRLNEASAYFEQIVQRSPELFLQIYWPRLSEVRARAKKEVGAVNIALHATISGHGFWAQHAKAFVEALPEIRSRSWTPEWLAHRQLESYSVFG